MLPLSILDLAIVIEGGSPREAINTPTYPFDAETA